MTRMPNLMLKFGAVIFAILWTAWMICWRESDGVNAIILGFCGTGVGYGVPGDALAVSTRGLVAAGWPAGRLMLSMSPDKPI